MLISDWSSDVCSSDLAPCDRSFADTPPQRRVREAFPRTSGYPCQALLRLQLHAPSFPSTVPAGSCTDTGRLPRQHLSCRCRPFALPAIEIGRASGREDGCQYVWTSGVAVSLKK